MIECLTGKKVLMKGNYAIANAAVIAGCDCYFGYPITPQSEIGEFMSGKMQELGRAYVSAESELAAINMCIGACSTGKKAMTSSSSCAISLMQEGLSYATSDELPIVLISVMRGGPGLGNIFPSQGDYNQATIGGGDGDYKLIVLSPSNVQEAIDLTYKTFYLAHKYRNPAMLLADGLLGQMMEPVEFGKYPYAEIDNSSWALSGAKGRNPRIIRSYSPTEGPQCEHIRHLFDKYKQLEENEVMYEELYTDDADLLVLSFGSLSRNVKAAIKQLRDQGMKIGFFRPITLFPFPNKRLNELSRKVKKFLTIEVNMGQMVRDVRLAVNGNVPVEFYGKPVGSWPSVEDLQTAIERAMI